MPLAAPVTRATREAITKPLMAGVHEMGGLLSKLLSSLYRKKLECVLVGLNNRSVYARRSCSLRAVD